MRLLELKTLKMNDNYPLIISLNGKVEMGKDKDINLVDRDEIGCSFSIKNLSRNLLTLVRRGMLFLFCTSYLVYWFLIYCSAISLLMFPKVLM